MNCCYQVTPKFSIGENVYTVVQKNDHRDCPQCGGKGDLVVEGMTFYCKTCNGCGKVQSNKKKWFVSDGLYHIEGYRVSIRKDEIIIKYRGHIGTSPSNRSEQFIFGSARTAQEYCDMLNAETKDIPLDQIVIPDMFKETIPSPTKIAQRVNEWKKHKKFVTKIKVDGNNTLLDGYSAYLVAKMLGEPVLRVEVA